MDDKRFYTIPDDRRFLELNIRQVSDRLTVSVLKQSHVGYSFYKDLKTDHLSNDFTASNGFTLRSVSIPEIIMDEKFPAFYARGCNKECDVIECTYYYKTYSGRQMAGLYAQKLIEAVDEYNGYFSYPIKILLRKTR